MKITGRQVSNPVAIIGTGPSGVAARWALEELNIPFEILDADLKEESEFHKPGHQQPGHLDLKLKMGSDLPYRQFRFGPINRVGNTKIKSSFTNGGFSEVWGATLLPYQQKTIEKWGLPWKDFQAAYKFVLNKIPYASFSNNLESKFVEFGFPKKMKIHSIFHKATLIQTDTEQIEFGASRLAIQIKDEKTAGCYYCNQCLSGCPEGYIWSSGSSAHKLIPNNSIAHRGIRVLRLQEIDQEIYVQTISQEGILQEVGPYSKIFLGCGPIETFRILSESGFLSNSTRLLDSPTFYFPLISRKSISTSHSEGIALSQLYCHLQGSPHKSEFHFQVYAQSDVLIERIISFFPPAKHIPRPLLRKVTKRLIICIGYRESSTDTQITLTKVDDGSILCEGSYNVTRFELKNEIRKRLFVNSIALWKAGFLFAGFGIKVGMPGEGVHYGANLQHNSSITMGGKVINSKEIFVVDSSALQSISAGPITLTIMANAYRIAKGAFR